MSTIDLRIAFVLDAVKDLASTYMLEDQTIVFDDHQTITIGMAEITVADQAGETLVCAYYGESTFHTVTGEFFSERQAAASALDWIKRHRIAEAADDFALDCGRAAEESVISPEGGFTPETLIRRNAWIIGGVVDSMRVPEATPGATMNIAYRGGVAAGYRAAARMDSVTLVRIMERIRQGALGVGGWTNSRGELILDVCDTARDEDLARSTAKRRGEEAIWHPEHGERTV